MAESLPGGPCHLRVDHEAEFGRTVNRQVCELRACGAQCGRGRPEPQEARLLHSACAARARENDLRCQGRRGNLPLQKALGPKAQRPREMGRAEWLDQLCRHYSERYEHLVRHRGRYTNGGRGERAERAILNAVTAAIENHSDLARRANADWARLIF